MEEENSWLERPGVVEVLIYLSRESPEVFKNTEAFIYVVEACLAEPNYQIGRLKEE